MENNNLDVGTVLANFVSSNRRFSYILFSLLFLLSIFTAYVYFQTILSVQAKDISAASKQMAESLKANTETIVPIPDIVKGFSSLIDTRVESEFIKKESEFNKSISDKLTKFNSDLQKSTASIDDSASEVKRIMSEVQSIKFEADKTLSDLRAQAKELSLLFPNVEKYKNIVDPEYLVRQLHSFNNWDEGASIVARMQDLVENSQTSPARLPAKYIELVGDWCREQKQSHLALEFYNESMKRDPDRISARVEFYALQAEVLPGSRSESIQNLTDMALSGDLKINQLKRIFNTLMELKEFKKLASLTDDLVKMERYKKNTDSLATLYRNNAVALKEESEYISDEAWGSIKQAVDAGPDDENVAKIYAYWLIEKHQYSEALTQARKLLTIDPLDISYYLIFADALIGEKNYDEARKAYDYALSIADERNDKIKVILAARKLPDPNLNSIIGLGTVNPLTKP